MFASKIFKTERMVNFIKDRIKDIFSDILINSYSNE